MAGLLRGPYGTKAKALLEWDKSIQYFEVCRKNKYKFLSLYEALGDNYRAKGFYDKTDEVLEYCLENISDSAATHLNMACNYLAQAKLDSALAEVDKAITRDPTFPWNSSGYLRFGQPEKALEECEKGRKFALEIESDDYQRQALHMKVLSYLRKGSMEEAQKTAEELKQMIQSGINKKKIRLYTHLAGMIELERKNHPKAIEYLGNAVESLPYGPLEKDASFIDSLALAYYKSGDLEKARETYGKITSLTLRRFLYGDIFAKSFYMLGKIYDQKGQKEKAIENYTKFFDLWKDADPGFQEVEDAKKRLAGLKGN